MCQTGLATIGYAWLLAPRLSCEERKRDVEFLQQRLGWATSVQRRTEFLGVEASRKLAASKAGAARVALSAPAKLHSRCHALSRGSSTFLARS